ncbi:MAG: hypothetical protein WDZ28_04405 [Simkaniaceae bacterium]
MFICSLMLAFTLSDTLIKSDEAEYEKNKIYLNGNVVIEKEGEWQLKSDLVEYLQDSKIVAKEKTSPCFFKHALFEAQSSFIELTKERLMLHNVRGAFFSKNSLPFSYRANQAFLDPKNEKLTLEGQIHVTHEIFGTMHCLETLSIQNQHQLSHVIESKGETTLKLGPHTFIAKNGLKLDENFLIIESKDPILYLSEELEIGANSMTLTLMNTPHGFVLRAFDFRDEVAIIYKDREGHIAYGSAKRAHYTPFTKSLTLFGSPKDPLLFWNDQKSIELRAEDEIEISYGQRYIISQGAVHITLTDEEKIKLKKFL